MSVVNLHRIDVEVSEWTKNPNNIYIGRQKHLLPESKWHNPYPIRNNNRAEAVNRFERYIRDNKGLLKDIHCLKGKTLGCWCHPEACHGNILQKLLQETMASNATNATNADTTTLEMETIIVKNIGKDISEQDLIDLFSLAKTDGLKNSHRMTVVHGSDETTACIEVPIAYYDMIMKLNGVSFKGRDLVLTRSGTTENETNITDELEGEQEPEEEPIQYLELDTRIPEWNFNQVTDFEVVEAIQDEFPDDYSKSVEDLGRYRKNLQGLFRIDSDDYSLYKEKTLTIRDKELTFRPKYQRKREGGSSSGPTFTEKREGTLITIHGAYRGPHRDISNDEFDDYFTNIQVEIIKPTEPQVKKRTSVLNNNRYLVVQKLDGDEETQKRIKSSIVVHGKKFNIWFEGMKKHCFLCGRAHGKDCPTRARFEHLKAIRDQQPRKRAVYSSSVLAHVNQLATTADFACMSGGGIGQVINSIAHDEKHDQVTIAAGTNEIVHVSDTSEFVFTINHSLEKLRALAAEVETSFLMPSLALPTPVMKARYDYLESELAKIPEVKVIKPKNVEMDGYHPTAQGTETILQALHAEFKDLILDEAEKADLTTKRYVQVKSLYKVGCRTCDSREFTAYLCEACKSQCPDANIDTFNVFLAKAEKEMYPTAGKRSHESSDEDENPSKR